jgi:TPR repeat protein
MEKTEITEKNPKDKEKSGTTVGLRTQVLIFGLFASVLLFQYLHSVTQKEKHTRFSQAVIDLDQDRYAAAIDVFLPLALDGHAPAQTQLGFLYLKGNGFQKDKIAAAKWFALAANQDQPEALYQLAKIYEAIGQEFQRAYLGECLARRSRRHIPLTDSLVATPRDLTKKERKDKMN